jgi:hypothetical protein
MAEQPPTRPGPIVPPKRSKAWIILVIAGVVMILLGVAAVIGLMSLMLPSVSAARAAAGRMKSQVQLSQLAVAMDVYASDHGGAFPADAAAWQDALLDGGLASQASFVAPQARPGMTSYYYVPGWTNTDVDRILLYENPDLYESEAGDEGGGEGRGGHIVFVGGTVEWVEGPEYLARIDSIALRDGTPYSPHREDD